MNLIIIKWVFFYISLFYSCFFLYIYIKNSYLKYKNSYFRTLISSKIISYWFKKKLTRTTKSKLIIQSKPEIQVLNQAGYRTASKIYAHTTIIKLIKKGKEK
jgi:hypothetical protein